METPLFILSIRSKPDANRCGGELVTPQLFFHKKTTLPSTAQWFNST